MLVLIFLKASHTSLAYLQSLLIYFTNSILHIDLRVLQRFEPYPVPRILLDDGLWSDGVLKATSNQSQKDGYL